MLATLVAEPFDRPGRVYEEKYDGDRMLAYKEGTRVQLYSRNAKDNTRRFPEIVAAIGRLRPATLLLDAKPAAQRVARPSMKDSSSRSWMCSMRLPRSAARPFRRSH